MARLLHQQEEEVGKADSDILYDFALVLIERLLEVYASELTAEELTDIREISKVFGDS